MARRSGRGPAAPAALRGRRLVALHRPQCARLSFSAWRRPRPKRQASPERPDCSASRASSPGRCWASAAPSRSSAVMVDAPQPREQPAAPAPEPADQGLVAALERLMTAERAHRQDGLTIGTLAQQLGLQEYRLRRLINQALGYRNFNSFVNHYRIAEVKAALADPGQSEVPVLTIALDAGFRSLGPFNRAFKAETGMTPSEYRRLPCGKAADSEIGQPISTSTSPISNSARQQSGRPLGSPDGRPSPGGSSGRAVHAPFHFPRCWPSPSSWCRAAPASSARPTWRQASSAISSVRRPSSPGSSPSSSIASRSPPPCRRSTACPATRSIAARRGDGALRRPAPRPAPSTADRWAAWCCTASRRRRSPCRRRAGTRPCSPTSPAASRRHPPSRP